MEQVLEQLLAQLEDAFVLSPVPIASASVRVQRVTELGLRRALLLTRLGRETIRAHGRTIQVAPVWWWALSGATMDIE